MAKVMGSDLRTSRPRSRGRAAAVAHAPTAGPSAAPAATRQTRGGQIHHRHVLAHARAHEERGIFGYEVGQEPAEQIVGELARRQRQTEAHDLVELGEIVYHEVGVPSPVGEGIDRRSPRQETSGCAPAPSPLRRPFPPSRRSRNRPPPDSRTGRPPGVRPPRTRCRARASEPAARSCDTMTSKSSGPSSAKFSRARSIEARPFRLITPTGRPRDFNPRTACTAPTFGRETAAASSSKSFENGVQLGPPGLVRLRGDELQDGSAGRTADRQPDGLEVDGARLGEGAVEVEQHGLESEGAGHGVHSTCWGREPARCRADSLHRGSWIGPSSTQLPVAWVPSKLTRSGTEDAATHMQTVLP